MSSTQPKYLAFISGGCSRTRPSRTASPAALASGPTRTNHCSDCRGSTVVPQRLQCPTECTYGRFSATIRPVLAQRANHGRASLEPVQALERARAR